VIVDASFVSAAERIAAVTAAAGVSADLVQLRCTASRELAARRINARTRGASDADRAVAEAMRAAAEPWPDAIVIDTEHGGTAELPGQGLEVALAAIRPHGPEHLWRPTRLHMLPEQRSLPISPGHDKACEAISLRRHCPDQVLGVAIRLSPDDLSAFPADLAPGLRHPGHLRGMAPSLVSQVLEVCSARYVIAGAERPDHEVFGPSC
jgi:hypothetical protein